MLKLLSIGPVVTCWGLHQAEYMLKARNERPSFGICVSNYVKDWATTLRRRRYDKYYQYLLIVILCALQFHLLIPMSCFFFFFKSLVVYPFAYLNVYAIRIACILGNCRDLKIIIN